MSLLDVLIVLLIVGWATGKLALGVTSGLLNLLILIAFIVLIVRILQGRAL